MLDLSYLRDHKDEVKEALKIRAPKLDFDAFLLLDADRRNLLRELESLRGEKNKANDEITALLKEKQDPKPRIASMKSIAQNIDKFESKVGDIELKIKEIQLIIPNIPHKSVKIGTDSAQNTEIKNWGSQKKSRKHSYL